MCHRMAASSPSGNDGLTLDGMQDRLRSHRHSRTSAQLSFEAAQLPGGNGWLCDSMQNRVWGCVGVSR